NITWIAHDGGSIVVETKYFGRALYVIALDANGEVRARRHIRMDDCANPEFVEGVGDGSDTIVVFDLGLDAHALGLLRLNANADVVAGPWLVTMTSTFGTFRPALVEVRDGVTWIVTNVLYEATVVRERPPDLRVVRVERDGRAAETTLPADVL